jgi:senataxin
VLGNSGSLIKGQYWRKLVEDAQARDCYTTGNIMSMLAKPSDAFPASNLNTSSMEDVPVKAEEAAANGIKQEKPSQDPRKVNGAHSDRMEGVRYKFEDRVSKPRASEDPRIKQERASSPKRAEATEDVEMEDAVIEEPIDTSRAIETSRSAALIKEDYGKSAAAEPAKTNGTSAAPREAPVAPRKRPQSTPFMPRKKPRPGAQ